MHKFALRNTARAAATLGFILFCAASAQAAVIISTEATKNETCIDGVCTPTAKEAVLNVGDLTNMLSAGDVIIKTDAKAKNILINAAFSWTSASRLTLDAYQNILVQQPVTVAGTGALTIVTNDGGADGDYSFVSPGSIAFWDLASSLIINGQSFTLVPDIKTLARDIAANPSGDFALANDYNASKDGTYANAAIRTPFTGLFEGLGNSILKLTIESKHYQLGLFLNTAATIRDVRIRNALVEQFRGCGSLGILAAESGGIILQTDIQGIVRGSCGTIGGLVGSNTGVIERSTVTANVYGGNHRHSETMGELAGLNSGSIWQCHSKGRAVASFGSGTVGGLVGENTGMISESSASGYVLGKATVGGLVGYSETGAITASFSDATVRGILLVDAGGLIGNLHSGSVANSYANGDATTGKYVGGFVGEVDDGAAISAAYSTGQAAGNYAGGFAGNTQSGGQASFAYWDLDTSRNSDATGAGPADGITGLTDAQLKASLPLGFRADVWGQNPDINNGYPYLLANPPE